MDPDRLRAIPVFASLNDQTLRSIATFATETSVAAGKHLKTLRTASVVSATPVRLVTLSHWDLKRVGGALDEIRATLERRKLPGVDADMTTSSPDGA